MRVCAPITPDGQIDRWGRARRVLIVDVDAGELKHWEELDVGWDELHETGTEGAHHARVARFLRDHQVETVIASRMGPDMQHMLGKLGVTVRLGVTGNARRAAATAALDAGRTNATTRAALAPDRMHRRGAGTNAGRR